MAVRSKSLYSGLSKPIGLKILAVNERWHPSRHRARSCCKRTMLNEPECSKRHCAHFIGIRRIGGGEERHERPVCHAFPTGIPRAIAYGDDPHILHHEGDAGIVYQEEGTSSDGEMAVH